MKLCTCFIKALGYNSAFSVSRLSIAQRRLIYNRRSLACHPDRQPTEKKDEATQAQTLLNLTREQLIDYEQAAARYPQSGVPAAVHDCEELEQAAQRVDKFSGDMPTPTTDEEPSPLRSPAKGRKLAPGNPLRWLAKPIRSRDHNSPPNTPRVGPTKCRQEDTQIVHLTDSSDSDNEVQVVGWVPPTYSRVKRPYASPEGPISARPKRPRPGPSPRQASSSRG